MARILLPHFPAVEVPHLSGKLIDPALDDSTTKEMVARVFPALRLLKLDVLLGQLTRSIAHFVAARERSGCPVTMAKTRKSSIFSLPARGRMILIEFEFIISDAYNNRMEANTPVT